MNIETYDNYCKELAELARQATNLDGLDEATREELAKIRAEILANHYKIVLLGSFQGGKSTIFNTACGGRLLSPTGTGLRTSACAAEAHYLEEGEEYARINWRSDAEILLGFIEALLPHLGDLVPQRFKGKSVGEAVAGLDLANPADRELLRQAHHVSSLEHKKDRCSFTSDHGDLLKIAGLTLRHCETAFAQRRALEAQDQRMPIEQASRWIRFPADWFERPVEQFRSEEVMFLFIQTAQFHVRSPELQQLRAVVVDCPGLHASAWDTLIANRCVQESHAVVWLQGTEGRELSKSELETARRFGEYGISHEGIFIAFNARGASERASQRILDANLAKLAQEADCRIPRERVVIFNALLALRAKQFALYESGRLPADNVDSLSEAARDTMPKLPEGGADPRANARALIRRDLRLGAAMFLDEEVEEFDGATVERLGTASRWQEAVRQAAKFVIQHRGRSRLIDRGSARVQRALEHFRQALVAREETAGKTVDQHRAEKAEAEQALRSFKDAADGVKFRLERDLSVPGEGAGEQALFLSMRSELRSRLQDCRPQLRQALEQVIDSAQQERDVAPRVRQRVSEYMQARVTGWQVDLKAGESPSARSLYVDLLEKVNEEMQRLLREALGRGGTLLKGLDLALPELNVSVIDDYQADSIRRFLQVDQFLDWADQNIPCFRAARDCYEAIRNFFTREPFNRGAWKDRLEQYLDAVLGGKLDEFLSCHVGAYLQAYKSSVAQQIDEATGKFRADYEQRVAQREQDLQAGIHRQQEIASDCQALRTNTIEPFQQQLDTFTDRVTEALQAE